MRSLLYVALLAPACGFSARLADAPSDGDVPDAPEGPPDARQCFGAGFGMTCLPALPAGPRQLSMTTSFDTGDDAACTHVLTVGGAESCVLTGTTITLPTGTFRAIGPRPLVLVATETVTIGGAISVSSLRGQSSGAGSPASACGTPSEPESDAGGGGGGAGGSFAGRGGGGGIGDLNDDNLAGSVATGSTAVDPIAAIAALRAGCHGRAGGSGDQPGGAGGAGGGAMYIIAATSITITGGAFAVGAGGNGGSDRGAGGGGGSGGLIGLDAPTVTIDGFAVANGGGGGEGAGQGTTGGNGSDAPANGGRAFGGAGGDLGGGNGGLGSGAGIADGDPGLPADGGGGGGGGGAGFIYVKGTLMGGGTISPAASVN